MSTVAAKWLFLFTIASLFFLTGCKKDNVDPINPPTPTVTEPLAITANITAKTTLIDRVANPELPDYIVTKSIDVNNELTINPGVVVAFERDVRMNVNDNGGLLIAKGEAAKKIRFIGLEKTKGFWMGIALYSGSNANTMEYVEVMHAGSRPIYSTTKSALFMSGGSRAQIGLKN
ncbi:MAG: right-handed parallel beta-helix repeat-containing protein, partial [Spirosoma sp.]|nr:right-handed parallel beta-helix repeat-containing protein [Spirosoma sp.]